VRDSLLVLDDMIEAVERLIELGAAGMPDAVEDRDRGEALLFNLIVLGEAAKRVPERVRTSYPDVDWRSIAATRDKIVHHYEGVEWPIIDDMVRDDLPALLPRLRAIRDELETGGASD
jgi:uncharacterized protein with HEPN domain